jgi:hypothetical protein
VIVSTPFPITDHCRSICSLQLNSIIYIVQSTNMHTLPFNGYDQRSLLVRYNTFSHFVGQVHKLRTKSIYCRPLKYVRNLYSIWTQLKMWQGKKLGHICLIQYILAILDLQSIPWELKDNGTATMLVPNSKEVNEILLLKRDQHGSRPHHCKSRIDHWKTETMI